MPRRRRPAATKLADGWLCSDLDFGCYRSDDAALEETLRAVATPDSKGWQRVSSAAWRMYGETSSGQLVYVEVRDADWAPGPRSFSVPS